MRKQRTLWLFVALVVGFMWWKASQARRAHFRPAPSGLDAPFPFPPVARPPAAPRPWVESAGGGAMGSHPVKVKLASGIYHVPGGRNYARTRADRCYVDAAAAEADGYRAAKQ